MTHLWPTLSLGELTARTRPICYGVLKPGPYDPSGVPLLRIQDLADDRVSSDGVHMISASLDEEFSRSRLAGGEVLLSIQGTVGRVAICPGSLAGANVSRTIAVIHPDERVDPEFLRYFLLFVTAKRGYETGGTTRASLNISTIREMQVPVPPLEEQRRIVDILEDHLSRLNAAEGLVAKSKASVSNLAQLLLERSVAESGPARRLDDLTTNAGYGTSEKCVQGGAGVPVVRITNLVSGQIDLTDEKRVRDEAADLSRQMLVPGDLLVIRTNGSRDLIGRAAVVQEGVDAAFASYLIRFQLDRRLVLPEWVRAVLTAPSSRRLLESLAASSAGQYNLSLSKLGGVPIPVPSLGDQARLLRELDLLLDGLARSSEQTLRLGRRTVVLRRALLAAAFSGRLAARTANPV